MGKYNSLLKTEDWWAVWLGLGIVLVALISYALGSTIKPLAVAPPQWADFGTLKAHFAEAWPRYLLLLIVWLALFTASTRIIGFRARQYMPGFVILFVASTLILTAGSWKFAKTYNLEPPILALILGLIVGNLFNVPNWLKTTFRTEYYIKTGIVLLGATLPLTLIIYAGPTAFFQATIVSLVTFMVIYWAGTRIFRLDRRFASVLGAGGAVCGVSAAIASGAATKADKEHISVTICIVALWSIVMIFFLTYASKALNLAPGVAGAWIGTSEFADAAGFAAASSIGGEVPIYAYTLMKVIGRDIWIGIWAFVLSIISVVWWEKGSAGARERISAWVIWERFPKFVIGFAAASIIMSFVASSIGPEEFNKALKPLVIGPVKTLRTWAFVFTFLSIGLTTRFRELFQFGWKPISAFTIGVLVNVPLGYILSTIVFKAHWLAIR